MQLTNIFRFNQAELTYSTEGKSRKYKFLFDEFCEFFGLILSTKKICGRERNMRYLGHLVGSDIS